MSEQLAYVTEAYEATYGITNVVLVGSEAIVWDRVDVLINSNSTNPAVGGGIQSIINATYASDSKVVPSLTVNVNRNGTWYATNNFTDSRGSEGVYQYTTKNITETTYGLTAFSSNTLSVTWGGLFVEISNIYIPATRVNLNAPAYAYYYARWSITNPL